jgi:DNA-binding NarL/FixJ family response regulator
VVVYFMAHAIALPAVSEVIRVLAADATRMNSQLLAAALERDKRFEVLDPVSDARGIISAVAKEKPAVVVISAELDEDKRKGFEVARELRTLHGETRVVMLIDASEHKQVVEAFRAGARGVFCRSESLTSLAKCIQCVSEGQIWANSRELRYLLEALGEAMPLRVIDARGTALLSLRGGGVVEPGDRAPARTYRAHGQELSVPHLRQAGSFQTGRGRPLCLQHGQWRRDRETNCQF